MIGDVSGHRWCGPAPGMDQTRMGCAEIIDRTSKEFRQNKLSIYTLGQRV